MLLRVKYSKTPAGRFLSHLDLLRAMERAFRRADLPLAFSEGFNPHPRISFGSALAVGITSDGEYLDVQLVEEISPQELKTRLDKTMPPALKVLAVKKIKPGAASLSSLINMARYRVSVPLLAPLDARDLETVIAKVMSQSNFEVIRQGKKGLKRIDVREGIYDMRGYPEDNMLILTLDVKTGSQGSIRPEEAVKMLEETGCVRLGQDVRIHREGLYIREDGLIRTPLEV